MFCFLEAAQGSGLRFPDRWPKPLLVDTAGTLQGTHASEQPSRPWRADAGTASDNSWYERQTYNVTNLIDVQAKKKQDPTYDCQCWMCHLQYYDEFL